MYKIRVVFDTEKDIIRTLVLDENKSLEVLHYAIVKAFGFDASELASFYRADKTWSQGEEIPLCNMTENAKAVTMAVCTLKDTLTKKNDKLIYVYDFLRMLTFYVELIDFSDEKIKEARVILSVGDISKEKLSNFDYLQDFNDPEHEHPDDIDTY
ncbi:MAG: IS1096 element passenger TnpR family protein [Tenacibaculum sp.]